MKHLAFTITIVACGPIGSAAPVSVTTITGRTATGEVKSFSISAGLQLEQAGGEELKLSAAEIDHVDCGKPGNGNSAAGWLVVLWDGSRTTGEPAGGDEQSLTLTHALLGRITIQIESIRFIQRRSSSRSAIPPSVDEDVAILSNGESIRGSVARFARDTLIMTVGANERALPWNSIELLVPAPSNKPALCRTGAIIELADGTRLRATDFDWKGDRVDISAAIGKVTARSDLVGYIELVGFRRTWLGDLPVKHAEAKPYFQKQWPMQVDANAVGGPLTASGQTYRHGIGLHSACKITWSLDGRFSRFRCLVAMDDSAGSMADADVFISLDGKPAFEARALSCSAKPRNADIDVSGVKELAVEVGFGKSAHIQDRVNLLDAALTAP